MMLLLNALDPKVWNPVPQTLTPLGKFPDVAFERLRNSSNGLKRCVAIVWVEFKSPVNMSAHEAVRPLVDSLAVKKGNTFSRLFTLTVIGLVLLFCFGVLLATFLNCRPFAKTWNPLLPGSCGSLQANVLSTSIINFVIDLSIVLLPMPMVWSLQIARSRKYTLTFIFALGVL